MTYESEVAERYRAHAKQLRCIAEFDQFEETRKMLIRVAIYFDKMAITMDQLNAMRRLASD